MYPLTYTGHGSYVRACVCALTCACARAFSEKHLFGLNHRPTRVTGHMCTHRFMGHMYALTDTGHMYALACAHGSARVFEKMCVLSEYSTDTGHSSYVRACVCARLHLYALACARACFEHFCFVCILDWHGSRVICMRWLNAWSESSIDTGHESYVHACVCALVLTCVSARVFF
jgi:hypothetical protein